MLRKHKSGGSHYICEFLQHKPSKFLSPKRLQSRLRKHLLLPRPKRPQSRLRKHLLLPRHKRPQSRLHRHFLLPRHKLLRSRLHRHLLLPRPKLLQILPNPLSYQLQDHLLPRFQLLHLWPRHHQFPKYLPLFPRCCLPLFPRCYLLLFRRALNCLPWYHRRSQVQALLLRVTPVWFQASHQRHLPSHPSLLRVIPGWFQASHHCRFPLAK